MRLFLLKDTSFSVPVIGINALTIWGGPINIENMQIPF